MNNKINPNNTTMSEKINKSYRENNRVGKFRAHIVNASSISQSINRTQNQKHVTDTDVHAKARELGIQRIDGRKRSGHPAYNVDDAERLREIIMNELMRHELVHQTAVEEIYKRAIKLIEIAATGQNIQEESKSLMADLLNLNSKFKKGQKVWVFASDDFRFINAEVTQIFNGGDGKFFYKLYEGTGRNLGTWQEDMIYATKKEIVDRISAAIDKAR